jgi:hypothetical protein
MVNSKLRRHKVMEKVIKKLMAGNLPPRFKFKDTYTSIDVPQGYQQYLPTQQQVEAEFNEMITEEEELPTVDAAVDDVKVISSNLYVQSNTGNVGIGTASPGYMLDVTGSANVGALTATSLNVSGPTNTVNLGLTHSLANRTTDTVFYSSDGNYIYKNTAAGLRTALDVPSASAAVFTGNVGVGTTNPGFSLDVRGTANVGTLTTTSLTIKDDPHPELNFNFTNSNWLQQQKLTAGTDAGASDQFGFSVSISSDGNTAIVGAWSDDDNGQSNSGSAYIFVRSGSSWTQQQKLTAGADAGASDYFGWSVSISSDGNTVIVGAYYDDDNGQSNSGSAYIFVRSGSSWTQQQKLTAGADAGAGDYFGQSVSISSDGSTAIVGARRDDDNGQSNSGSAYIFVRSGSSWTQQQKLTAGTDAGASDYFGYNVSISGDGSTAIVGAYRDDDNGQSDSGSAYIFVRSGSSWTQQQKLTAGTDAGASDYFGWSVSISGDGSTAIVGAHQDDDNGLYSSGSAYIFNAERALHIPKDINVSGAAVFTGNVGIGTSEPVAKLHVNGGITKTQYNPGEVIETLHGRADGSSITVLSGTYTLTNTGLQDVGTGHTVINGSSISYKPPPGTTRVIYELQVYTRLKDGDVLMHFAGRLAGTQVSHSRHTFRSRDYEQQWVYNNMTITIGQVASDNLAAGQLASWTTNKTLDFTARDYNTSLEGYLHRTDHWDGGGTDITVTPVIKITAIA